MGMRWKALLKWMGAGLGLACLTLAAGCATDPMQRLRSASLPTSPPPAEAWVGQGRTGDRSLGGYANYKAVMNSLGMQVGQHHFDKWRFPDYLAQAGFPKLADEARMALQRQELQNSLVEDQGPFGIGSGGGGDAALIGLGIEIVAAAVMETAIHDHNMALEEKISALARQARPFNGVADDYNRQVALRFGLNPTLVDTFPYRAMALAVSGPAEIGANASLDDWADDYALTESPAHWFLGDDRAKVSQVEAVLAPAGAESPFHWSRRLPWMAGAAGVAAAACLFYGAASYQSPRQSNTSLGIGAGLICAGLGLEWRAMDLRTLTFQRYEDFLKARLNPIK
jgi:hypothetical protein